MLYLSFNFILDCYKTNFSDGTAHQGSVTCVDAHRDNVLVATGSEDSTVKIVNTNSGKVRTTVLTNHFLDCEPMYPM